MDETEISVVKEFDTVNNSLFIDIVFHLALLDQPHSRTGSSRHDHQRAIGNIRNDKTAQNPYTETAEPVISTIIPERPK